MMILAEKYAQADWNAYGYQKMDEGAALERERWIQRMMQPPFNLSREEAEKLSPSNPQKQVAVN